MAASAGHARFAVFNHTVNPLVRGLLRSPLHPLVRSWLLLITVTGRASGREHTFPVGYRREGETVRIVVVWPERKRWWRNLTGPGAPVLVRIRGVERRGHAIAIGDEEAGVEVRIELEPA